MEQEAVRTVHIVIDSSGALTGGADVEKALKSIDDKVGAAHASIENFGIGIGNLFSKLGALAAAKLSFDAIIDQIRSITDAMEHLRSKSETLQVSTDFLQGFQFAAASSGVKIDSASLALDKFARTVGEAQLGSSAAVLTMNDLGVKIYDAAGKVRPLNDLMVDAAVKIVGMTDAGKQNALTMQAMGKSAQAVMPMLDSIAKGQAAMQAAAKAAGASVSDEDIKKWADLASAAEVSMLKWRAFAASNFAGAVSAGFDAIRVAVMTLLIPVQALINAFNTIKNFVAENNAPAATAAMLEQGIAAKQAVLDRAQAFATRPFQSIANFPGVDASNVQGQIKDLRVGIEADKARLDAVRREQYARGRADARGDDLVNKPPEISGTVGAGNAVDRTAGQSLASRFARQIIDANVGLQNATAGIGAADLGAAAVAQLDIHMKDLKEAADAYAKSGGDVKIIIDAQTGAITTNVAAVNKQVAALDEVAIKTIALKNLGAFILQTRDLQEQNTETQLQLTLQGQTTEEIARQVAQKKLLYDLDKQGILALAASNAAEAPIARQKIADGQAVIDQQFKLKTALDDTAKSVQLWLAPFSTALSGISNGFVTFFEGIINTGKASWQTLADTFKAIFIKMLAELAVLAVVRPIIAPIVQGIFSPEEAQQLGFAPGVGGIGGLASILGSGGGYSPGIQGGSAGIGSIGSLGGLFGGSGSSFLGGFGQWLNTPIMSPVAGPANALGDLGGAGLGGLTPLGAFGGVASIGMGAYSLLSGNGSTGSLLSGGAGIIGGGLSLLGPMLGLGAAAGPIGLGVGLVGSILGSLLGGDSGPKIPPQPPLAYGQGNFYASGGSAAYNGNGGDSLGAGSSQASGAASIGAAVMRLFRTAGLTPVAGQLIGGELAGGTDHTLEGGQWRDRPYTQIGLVNPQGGLERITYNDSSRNPQQAADLLFASVFGANVQRGGVSGASDTLKSALTNIAPTTQADTVNIVNMAKAYDQLGKALNPAKDAIDKINASFDDLTNFATKAGLSLDPINAEIAKQSKRSAQDFIDNMLDPLAVQLRALQDQRDSALASAQYIRDNISGVYVDINRITDTFAQRQTQLIDQYYSGAITNLQNLIQQATFGSLSGASPATALAGQRSLYETTLARAQGGDLTSITNLASVASGYLQAAQGYYGSGPDYQLALERVRAMAADEVASLQTGGPAAAGTTGGPAASSEAVNAMLQSNSATSSQMAALTQQVADLIASNASLTATVQRLLMSH